MSLTQKAIVESPSKRLLVLSCAGSGKTRVIVARIERLIEEGAGPSSILALTFSNRAAQEMKNRLNHEKEDKRFSQVNVRTFHAFGFEIIRNFSKEIGFDKRAGIADPSEIDAIMKSTLGQQKIRQPDALAFKEYVRQKKAFTTPKENEVLGEMFLAYQKSLRLKCLLDLDDLIYLPVLLLNGNADCRKIIQDQYQFIFVDEYQDTSEAQNRFLDLLIAPKTSVFLVGDDDQAIYEWRNAKPEYIRKKAFSGEFDCFYLTRNFRSEKSICDVANRIISHNHIRIEKNIEAERPAFARPSFHQFSSQEQEANYVANEIKRLLDSGKFSASDVAVLYRNNNQQGPIKLALNDRQIVAESLDVDDNFRYSRFVKVLKSIVDFHSSHDLSEALNFPNRFFDQMALQDAKNAYLAQMGESLPDEVMEALSILYSSEVVFPDDSLFRHRYGYIHQLHYAEDWSSTEVIAYLVSDFEVQGYDSLYPEDYRYLQQVLEMAKMYEESFGKCKLSDFVDNLLIAIGNNDENFNRSTDSVALLTIHRSKGLEFKVVFIVGLQVGIFPNDYFVNSKEELEAERRLFYVAVTRAKDLLFLSSFKDPIGAPSDSYVRCGFLAEIPLILYSKDEVPNSTLQKLPEKTKMVSPAITAVVSAEEIAKRNKEPLEENGLFDVGPNLSLNDEQIARYQNECLALSQQIKIPPKAMVVVIGAVDIKKDAMYGIFKSNGFSREQVEYYDYKDSQLNYRRYSNNENFLGVILGPNAHNQVGGYDLLSIFSQDGFPFLANLVKKHITKSSLQAAIIKIKLNFQKTIN